MAIFSTVHVPLVHPIYAAKALATVDHISNGRAGLNIVCGWNPTEFAMFGTTPDERAYERAAEWIEIVERAYASDEPFDFDGRLLQAEGRRLEAGEHPEAAAGDDERRLRRAGPRFRLAPLRFPVLHLHRHRGRPQASRRHRARAAAAGREVGAYTVCHVVCRATQSEAEDAYDRYALREADHGAVDNHMAGKKQFSQSHDERAYRDYRQRFAGGAGSYPLIGTPEKIAETMPRLPEGWSGAALTFLNYTDELPFFFERVLPLLKQAGLRVNCKSRSPPSPAAPRPSSRGCGRSSAA